MLITEGVYAIFIKTPGPLKTVNTYLLKDGDDSYLVDTNWPADMSIDHLGFIPSKDSWQELLKLFEEAGVDPRRLKGIIVTHAHADHMGHLPALQALTNAPVLLHQSEVQAHTIRSDKTWREAMGWWFRQHGAPDEIAEHMVEKAPTFQAIPLGAVRLISDGEALTVGSMQWKVLWTPGHSPGHICLLERRRGLILTGDHVLPHDTPNVHAHPMLPMNPLGSYIDSLRLVERLPIRQALPGHGPVMGDFQTVVASLISHHDVRSADVIEVLQAGPRDAFDVACTIPWVGRRMEFLELEHRERWMAFTETIAHLQGLEGRGIIKPVDLKGSIGWKLDAD